MKNLDNQNLQNDGNSQDYLAMGVFFAVLVILIVSALYLVKTSEEGTFANPLKTVSKWFGNYWDDGKRLLGQKKGTWSRKKREREVKKHLRTGLSLYRKKIYRKALHEFDKAIEIDPNNYRAYYWRGRVHLRLKRFKEATTDFKRVIKLKPDYADAYDNLGWLYLQLEEYDESIKYLSQSLELKPNEGWTYYTRGRCYFHKGDLQKALRDTKTSCSLGYNKGCQAYEEYSDEISHSHQDTKNNPIS